MTVGAADLGITARELVRIALVLPVVEVGTRLTGPKHLVAIARLVSVVAPERSESERRRLRGLIARVDGRISRRSKCYRRALVEMVLDRGAAAEVLHIGLHAAGGVGSGHAWLDAEGPAPEPFDVILHL